MNDVLNNRNDEVRDSVVNLRDSSRQGSYYADDHQLSLASQGQRMAKTYRKTKTSHVGRRLGRLRQSQGQATPLESSSMPTRDDALLNNLSPSNANIQIEDDFARQPLEGGSKVNLHYNKAERTGSRFSKNILSSEAASEHGDHNPGPMKFAPV